MIIGVSWVTNWLGENFDLVVKEEKKTTLRFTQHNIFSFSSCKKTNNHKSKKKKH